MTELERRAALEPRTGKRANDPWRGISEDRVRKLQSFLRSATARERKALSALDLALGQQGEKQTRRGTRPTVGDRMLAPLPEAQSSAAAIEPEPEEPGDDGPASVVSSRASRGRGNGGGRVQVSSESDPYGVLGVQPGGSSSQQQPAAVQHRKGTLVNERAEYYAQQLQDDPEYNEEEEPAEYEEAEEEEEVPAPVNMYT